MKFDVDTTNEAQQESSLSYQAISKNKLTDTLCSILRSVVLEEEPTALLVSAKIITECNRLLPWRAIRQPAGRDCVSFGQYV